MNPLRIILQQFALAFHDCYGMCDHCLEKFREICELNKRHIEVNPKTSSQNQLKL
jgi:hypothetical protein